MHEAFCVVYELPEWVQAQGYRVYFTLVDIGPREESGARQKHRPSRITEEFLEQLAGETSTAS